MPKLNIYIEFIYSLRSNILLIQFFIFQKKKMILNRNIGAGSQRAKLKVFENCREKHSHFNRIFLMNKFN